jgi:hypothetical protein
MATTTMTDGCDVFRAEYHMVVVREPKGSQILLRMPSLFRNVFKYITHSIHLCIDNSGALHCSINLARIPVCRDASLHHHISDETSSAQLPDVFLSSQDVCARHLATVQMHFATVAGSLHEVLKPLVRFVEGGEREGRSGVRVEDRGTICGRRMMRCVMAV